VIKYSLKCAQAHEFEAWFASIASYDDQAGSGEVRCPECGTRDVAKSVMAPHVSGRAREAEGKCPAPPAPRTGAELTQFLREVRRVLVAASEDVGARFPEEARRIHYGETEVRGIHGTASGEEARALAEEGIEIVALPLLPEDSN
jgi:hypothetical protein